MGFANFISISFVLTVLTARLLVDPPILFQ